MSVVYGEDGVPRSWWLDGLDQEPRNQWTGSYTYPARCPGSGNRTSCCDYHRERAAERQRLRRQRQREATR